MATYVICPADEQEKIIKAFLEALEIPFVKDDNQPLPQHVLDGIARDRPILKSAVLLNMMSLKRNFPSNNVFVFGFFGKG